GGGFDFSTHELRLDIGVNLHPLLDLDFDFDAASVGAAGFGVGLSGWGRLPAGAAIEFDAFLGADLDLINPIGGSFAPADAVFFGLNALRVGAGVRVEDLNLQAQVGPVSGGVLGGHGELVVAAEAAVTGGDANG